MFERVNRVLRKKLTAVAIVLPLVAILFAQSISNERLILRVSKAGEVSILSEQSTKRLQPSLPVDLCCGTMNMTELDCCATVQIVEPVETSVCCTDYMLGGGISIATTQTNANYDVINSAQYERSQFNLPKYNNDQPVRKQYFSHDPPGYVKTTILRI